MKNSFFKTILLLVISLPHLNAAPPIINYAGQVAVNDEAFDGIGLFKFAIVSTTGEAVTSLWSNDGTSTAGSEPDANVSVSVNGGLYSILLGNSSISGMSSLDPSLFSFHANLMLRVWFSDGANGFQHLSPDRPFASVPYALNAGSVNLGLGSVSRSMLASDIRSDLNGIIGKDRLSQQILDDLNRTITLAMLEPSLQSALSTSSVSTTISDDLNITNQDVIFANRSAMKLSLLIYPLLLKMMVSLVPINNNITIESIIGELNGADWAILNQSTELLSNLEYGLPFQVLPIWVSMEKSKIFHRIFIFITTTSY